MTGCPLCGIDDVATQAHAPDCDGGLVTMRDGRVFRYENWPAVRDGAVAILAVLWGVDPRYRLDALAVACDAACKTNFLTEQP